MRVEQIGDATLYLGDCLEILPTLGKVDAVITDPPYGMNALDGSRTARIYGINRRDNWDCKKPDGRVFRSMLSMSKEQIIWGYNYFAAELKATKCFLVWNKPSMVGMKTMAFGEIAFTNLSAPAKIFTCESEKTNREHPTQKPLPLMQWCLGFLPAAETILDPFMGSGTTGVACANLGRKFIGIEIEPKYFDIACRRIEGAYKQPRLFDDPKQHPKQGELI